MVDPSNVPPVRLGLPAVLGAYAVAVGLLSVVGWWVDLPRLADWTGTGLPFQPNSAMAAIAVGLAIVALARGWRRFGLVCAVVSVLVGLMALAEYVFNIDLPIDSARMAWSAATAWVTIGAGGMMAALAEVSNRRWRSVGSALGMVTAAFAGVWLLMFLFRAPVLFAIRTATAIALPTGTTILAAGLGLMLLFPDRGLERLVRAGGPAAMLVRRILPVVIVLPIVLAYVGLTGLQRGWFDAMFGATLRTTVEIVLMLGLVWWTARAVEAEFHQRQRAESELRHADRRKDEFLATLAHELRNPLAPMRSAVDVMKLEAFSNPEWTSLRDVLDRQVQVMTRLVDDLLDVSRIAQGRLELRSERVDLVVPIEAAIESCRPLLERRGHDLRVDVHPETIFVQGDAVRLGQVFGNLLNNACKYTNRGGQIGIRAEQRGEKAVVIVSDTGVGVPPDEVAHLFDLFWQGTAPAAGEHGLGIGLYLARQVIESHRGHIEARSSGVGQGSEFVVSLPISDTLAATRVRPAQSAATPALRALRRVLLVDDNVDAASSLATVLACAGNETHVAHDGEAALRTAERLRPDVVVLDIGLPRIDGLEVCRRLRHQPWAKHVFCIALTGWGQESDRRRSAEAGFDVHLVKPVDGSDLLRLLESRRAS